jgi:hypothetical protein
MLQPISSHFIVIINFYFECEERRFTCDWFKLNHTSWLIRVAGLFAKQHQTSNSKTQLFPHNLSNSNLNGQHDMSIISINENCL